MGHEGRSTVRDFRTRTTPTMIFLWGSPVLKEKRGEIRYENRIVSRRGSMQRSASLTLLHP